MYNAIFFRPKYASDKYENFIEKFRDEFNLKERKQSKNKYLLENNIMRVTIEPKLIEVLLDKQDNIEIEEKLREYFRN